jgi:MFS family permease
LPSLSQEFGISTTHVRFTTAALFIGLCIGASFWGIASDLVGRRLAFNMTLFICGIFGICVGASPTWVGYVSIGYPAQNRYANDQIAAFAACSLLWVSVLAVIFRSTEHSSWSSSPSLLETS